MLCKVTQMEGYNEDNKDQYELAKKQGGKITCDDAGNKVIEKLMLNEVFFAEKDPSKTSTY